VLYNCSDLFPAIAVNPYPSRNALFYFLHADRSQSIDFVCSLYTDGRWRKGPRLTYYGFSLFFYDFQTDSLQRARGQPLNRDKIERPIQSQQAVSADKDGRTE